MLKKVTVDMCIVPEIKREACIRLPLVLMLTVVLCKIAFSGLKKFASLAYCFYHERMLVCQMIFLHL